MTEPVVNTSIKAFSKLKGRPASSARFNPTRYDWGNPTPNGSAYRKGLFKDKVDTLSPLKQIGINPQHYISLPCKEVNDMANKRIKRGLGVRYDKQLVNATPKTGMDRLTFVASQRIGEYGMDVSQKPLAFPSFGC